MMNLLEGGKNVEKAPTNKLASAIALTKLLFRLNLPKNEGKAAKYTEKIMQKRNG